jgi:hypothetical protein
MMKGTSKYCNMIENYMKRLVLLLCVCVCEGHRLIVMELVIYKYFSID